MDANNPTPPPTEEQARQRRVQALNALAAGAIAKPSERTEGASLPPAPATNGGLRRARRKPAATLRTWHSPQRWRLLIAIMLVGAVFAAGGLVVASRPRADTRPAPTPPIPALLTLAPKDANLYCPVSVAWSPDGLRVAVGRTNCIDNSDPRRSLVTIFNARIGAVLRSFYIKPTLAKLGLVDGDGGGVTWSVDGKTLIVPVIYAFTPTATGVTYHRALLLQPADGGAAHLLRGPLVTVPTGGAMEETYSWNLRTGAVTPLTAAIHGVLPPAAAHQWTADGQLVVAPASTPSAPAAGSDGAVFSGSPLQQAASPSVSLWQPGYITPIVPPQSGDPSMASTPDEAAAPIAYFYQATALLQSPDGRYVVPDQTFGARLPVPGATQPLTPAQCRSDGFFVNRMCGSPALPVPDAAFAAVLATTTQGALIPGDALSPARTNHRVAAGLAWRPDGAVLAALLPSDGLDVRQPTARVTLYDTHTGQRIQTLTVQRTKPANIMNSASLLTWSPSGQQLAIYDYISGQVTIWGGSSLTAA